ncbi:DUF4232 domain-containing protein [Streptomyces sp. NPDC094032]|uniref:DUF4232 domain-containing protein n=1 Tax=Streptomyces sp. NPDC094032 TaxID=3155308 RepID=UPI00331C3BB4
MSTVRRAAFVTAAVAAALALTACGPSGTDAAGGGAGTAPTTAAPATATETAAPTATTTPPPKTSAPTKTAAPAKTGKPGTSAKPPTDPDYDVFPCSTYDVTFSADVAEKTTGSYLLKITNKTAKPCRVLGHPIVIFGGLDGTAVERGTAPSPEKSIRLEPGASAYAGLMGGPHDGKGKTVDSIAMTMDTESDLTQKPLKASTPGLYVSPDKNSVTAWMDNAEDALTL